MVKVSRITSEGEEFLLDKEGEDRVFEDEAHAVHHLNDIGISSKVISSFIFTEIKP